MGVIRNFQTVSEGRFSEVRWTLFLLWLLSQKNAQQRREKSVAYSVMVWLVDPGEQAHQHEVRQRTTTGRAQAPGAASGVNESPPSSLIETSLAFLMI